ncbi:hypothetical protein NBZ79_13200 [Sneathiella marina]|uniref:Uncharacterized protein n=1 Tax=Sneathiella marina TaxID=2950108 RepID=A0ABY4VYX5_9PROT|nr:hypothetical protein [Sneathiella marina]USG60132.1 hypothetical protein NBZ79_13200 [Sneathiella marina]
MQHPHAYHYDTTPSPALYHHHYHYHYHYSYLAHHNFGNTDASAHPHHPLKHLAHAENLHPHHLYARHPYHLSPQPQYTHAAHSSPQHYHQLEFQFQYPHTDNAHQLESAGHVLHFKKIIATSDTTKTHWVWHITDHRRTVVKTSEHIHSSFEECVRDARHYHTKLIIQHQDIEKTSWAWVVTDHHGVLIKKSTTIHATFVKCVHDAHRHLTAHDHSSLVPYHQADHAGHTLHFRKIVATNDATKTHWVWHICNHRKVVIKTSEHIHSRFEECVKDARHYDTKLIIEHKDIEKSNWAWAITDHHGILVKKSTTTHATFIKCIDDLHHYHGDI